MKLIYNTHQTELTLEVEGKALSKYRFVEVDKNHDYDLIPICTLCAFDGIRCEQVKCCGEEREDKRNGYYTIIE